MGADLILNRPVVAGAGAAAGKNCSVELLGLAIYGDYRYGFNLPCLDDAAQNAVVAINDRLSDEARQSRRWRLLVARLGLCHRHDNVRLHRRMALWAARSVEHLADDPRVKACNDTLERWLAGEATDAELVAARWAASDASATAAAAYADAAAADAAAYASYAAAAAAAAAYAADATAAATAAAAATTATTATGDDALMEWLDAYLTAWHKTAVDEGEAIPAEDDEAYQQFLAELDEVLA